MHVGAPVRLVWYSRFSKVCEPVTLAWSVVIQSISAHASQKNSGLLGSGLTCKALFCFENIRHPTLVIDSQFGSGLMLYRCNVRLRRNDWTTNKRLLCVCEHQAMSSKFHHHPCARIDLKYCTVHGIRHWHTRQTQLLKAGLCITSWVGWRCLP